MRIWTRSYSVRSSRMSEGQANTGMHSGAGESRAGDADRYAITN